MLDYKLQNVVIFLLAHHSSTTLECFVGEWILESIVEPWGIETGKGRKPINRLHSGSIPLENSRRECGKHVRSWDSEFPALIHHWLKATLEALMLLRLSLFVGLVHRSTEEEALRYRPSNDHRIRPAIPAGWMSTKRFGGTYCASYNCHTKTWWRPFLCDS